MFIGLAIVAFIVARGSLAVRNLIYQDKVRPSIHSIVYRIVSTHGHISRADNNLIFTARRNARIPSAVLATAIPSAFVWH